MRGGPLPGRVVIGANAGRGRRLLLLEALMIPSTVQRVPRHSPDTANRRIRDAIRRGAARARRAGPAERRERLRELDREWDIERVLEANAATVGLLGLGLGVFAHRRLLILPALVLGFLLQHAIQGWCPPVPLFRRLGVRTSDEIDEERAAWAGRRGLRLGRRELRNRRL